MLPDKHTNITLNTSDSDPSSLDRKQLHIPKSILTGSEEELDEELQITFGSLPSRIHGHVFIVGALTQHQEKNSQVYNGDGIIYRVDFVKINDVITARLKSKIAKPPCYYVDKATQTEEYKSYQFRNTGLARVGKLGSRNQLNTGFLSMDSRLLVTYDAGRPYEVDPETMELLKPIGTTSEWIGAFSWVQERNSVFMTYFTPAHPTYDFENQAVISVNYSTGFSRVLPEWIRKDLNPLIKRALGGFTDLVRYCLNTGTPKVERWRLFLENNETVIIEQSLHQVAITKNYIVLADIAFPLEISQVLFPLIFRLENLTNFPRLKHWISATFLRLRKQRPFTNFYIVKRSDLDQPGDDNRLDFFGEKVKSLRVRKVVIPREVSHFLVDYNNPENLITIHLAHNNAWDVTEWIRDDDEPAPNSRLRSDLAGLVVGPLDVGFLGRYVIDGESGALLESRVVSDPDSTWSVSLYTHNDMRALGRISDIYWLAWGFSMEVVPKRIFEAYQSYEYRGLPLENFTTPNGYHDKPVQLLRLNTSSMKIEDSYPFEPGYFSSSPQFVPCFKDGSEAVDDSTSGYIICTVYSDNFNPLNSTSETDEIWIFDAKCLRKGPLCKLGHKKLNLKLTIHSTWLAELKRHETMSKVNNLRYESVRNDYHSSVDNNFPELTDFFEREVYRKYASQESVLPSEEKYSRIES